MIDPKAKEGLKHVFYPGGVLEEHGFVWRQPQVDMARHVALQVARAEKGEKSVLLIEAPTGTGKSFAYLIPAIEHAVRTSSKVIVATSNIALQEQLIEKDLPFLRSVLPWQFHFELLKGKSNYLCRDALVKMVGKLAKNSMYENQDEREARERLMGWAEKTQTGDKSEIDFHTKGMWGKVSVTGQECHGKACKFYEDCFVEKARQGIDNAEVIVVNYHYLMAMWRIVGETGQDFLDHTVLICDEAHDMPEIARSVRTVEFFGGSVNWFASRVKQFVPNQCVERFQSRAQKLLSFTGDAMMNYGDEDWLRTIWKFHEGQLPIDKVIDSISDIVAELTKAADMTLDKETRAKIGKATEISRGWIDDLKIMAAGTNEENVCWAENHRLGIKMGEMRPVLKRVPISAADFLKEHLYRDGRATIIASATLTTSGSFDYIAGELATPKTTRAVSLESPFDLQQKGLLYLPQREHTLNTPKALEESIELIWHAIQATEGGVLALFTSHKAMKKAAQSIAPRMGPRSLYVQGELPRSRLLEMFRNDTASVLMGTRSFFQGVDVPGKSLECVIIDRVPFPVPSDPVVEAIQAMHESYGGNGWRQHSLPLACLTIAQAGGRLIRRDTDRGAVVLLDPRVVTKSYGKKVISSLPPFRMTRSREEFETFMKS